MQGANHIAFKEWAVICAALADGRQTLILRKGGIQEGRGGFQVEHREFWLFPTYLHQDEQGLIEEARPLLERTRSQRPPEEIIRIGHYTVVEEPHEVADLEAAFALAGHHIWSARTVEMRFNYRRS